MKDNLLISLNMDPVKKHFLMVIHMKVNMLWDSLMDKVDIDGNLVIFMKGLFMKVIVKVMEKYGHRIEYNSTEASKNKRHKAKAK